MRCDYDLGGEVATWLERCPLEGRCPECGLGFEWTEVFNEGVAPGFAESVSKGRVRAVLRTYWRSLRPWSFWRWVTMDVPLRHDRQVRSLLTLGLVALVFVVLLSTVTALGVSWYAQATPVSAATNQRWYWNPSGPLTFGEALWHGLLGPWHQGSGWPFNHREVGVLAVLAVFSVAPWLVVGLYSVLPTTLRRARVRPGHLVRMAVYGNGPAVLGVLWLWVAPTTWSMTSSLISSGHAGWHAFDDLYEWSARVAVGAVVFAVFVHPLVWFGFANWRYLKIRHPWWVALVLVLTADLAMVVVWLHLVFHTSLLA